MDEVGLWTGRPPGSAGADVCSVAVPDNGVATGSRTEAIPTTPVYGSHAVRSKGVPSARSSVFSAPFRLRLDSSRKLSGTRSTQWYPSLAPAIPGTTRPCP